MYSHERVASTNSGEHQQSLASGVSKVQVDWKAKVLTQNFTNALDYNIFNVFMHSKVHKKGIIFAKISNKVQYLTTTLIQWSVCYFLQ